LRKEITSFVMIFLILTSVLAVSGVAAQPSEKVAVIVGFKGKPETGLIRAHSGDIKYEYSIISAVACSLPQGAIDALNRNPKIAYIEPDGQVQITQTLPWGVDRIDAEVVHQYGNKGTGVKVAIIDTGIDYNHPDLVANYEGGIDFVEGDGDPMDDNGHGTHCAGIVAAEDNEIGVIGVAPKVWLYAVKVLDDTGSGSVTDVIAGIDWATINGMQIISMSLGSDSDSVTLHSACDAAYGAGVLVVAAAGNDYQRRGRAEVDTVDYPARYDSVIAVGATDVTDTKASWSSTGSALELAAPGVYIYSTYLDSTYDTYSGTSMACPHVVGTAALVWAGEPTLTNVEVRTRLQETADDLGSDGWDGWYGYGLVDADEAAAVPSVDTTPPTISDLTPPDGTLVNTATPTISATVTDASGIDVDTIAMTVDETTVTPIYDTGLVSYVVTETLSEGSHTVILNVLDTVNNQATASWSFTVDTTPPVQVTGVMVTTVSSSQLDVSWTAESDLEHYNVYRSTTSGGPYDLVASPTTSSYSDIGLTASTTYYYVVSAVDKAGNEGSASDEAEGTTSEAPALPTMHVASIDMSLKTAGVNTNAIATVTIFDASNKPVEGATVYGHWEDATTDSDSSITDASGKVSLQSNKVKKAASGTTFTFVVDNVVLIGWTYDPLPTPSGSIITV